MITDDTPLKFIREFIACHDYYNAPGMNAVHWESKFDLLKRNADRLITEREQEHGIQLRVRTSEL